jgi:DNA-binding Lrp family transcriptional regulator
MTNGKLDDLDIRILNLLQKDARTGLLEIVRGINLSKTPTAKRIRKLKDKGYIKKFVTVLNREKIGQPVLVITHVKLDKQTTPELEAFEAMVNDMPEVQFCLHVSGSWNFILHVTAPTPQAYFDFLLAEITGVVNIAHVESCFVMKECKSYAPFILEKL